MSLHSALTKLWLRKYKKQTIVPSVRAVFLGDGVSTAVILHGVYERYELIALQKFVFSKLDKGSCCLDIGANIGNHACTFSEFFSTVYAFEPNPPVRYVLQANTYGKNIEVIDCGLSNAEGTVYFKQNFTNLGASKIVADESTSDSSIRIKTLDSVIKERSISDVSFVKIDVEGHEAQVLQGGNKFFKEQQPIVAMEAFFQSNPKMAQEVLSTLETLGYQKFYSLEVRSRILRVLRQSLGTKITNVIGSFLPKEFSKAVVLTEVQNPLLADHQLLICSIKPLET